MSETPEKPRKLSGSQRYDELLHELSNKFHNQRSWADLTETVQVPDDLATALGAMRPELVRLIQPRA